MEFSVKRSPLGLIAKASFSRQRAARGMSLVMQMSAFLDVICDPIVRRVRALGHDDQFDQWVLTGANATITHHIGLEGVSGGDTQDFILDRTGVRIDVNFNHKGSRELKIAHLRWAW